MPIRRQNVLIFSVLAFTFATFVAPRTSFAEALAVGAAAPAFELKNINDAMVSLESGKGSIGTLVVFTCNHCPFAIAYEDRIVALANEFQPKGVNFIAINSNDPLIKPEDGFESMKKRAADKAFTFPYLVNEDGSVAKAYGAARTPEAFLLDADGKIVYHGRIDDNTEAPKVTVHDLKNAMTKLVAGEAAAIDPKSTAAFGCTIKFRK